MASFSEKHMKYIIIIFLSVFSYSCVSGQKDRNERVISEEIQETENDFDFMSQMEEDFIGEWANVSMRVMVRTYNNSDTSFMVDINEDNWELKMNIKPIVTTVFDDGTYISEFRNSFDSLIYKPKGTWIIDGDSLIMEDHQAVYRYQIFIDGDRAEFKSLVDWDNDGKNDDEYFGVQRKQGK